MMPPGSVRPIALLSVAAFASAATLRVVDPLIPQLVAEFGVTAGSASVVATAFAVSYGCCQIAVGALGDRYGKYLVVMVATFLCAMTVSASALAPNLAVLGAIRLASGATAGAIIPLAMAYLGDVVPYENRQTVLARFLSGQILGVIGGQVLGGLFGDTLGWRGIFVALGAVYLVIGLLLLNELRSPRVEKRRQASSSWRASAAAYLRLLQSARVRAIVGAAFVEAFFFFGAFVYLGAYLRHRFGLTYLSVGSFLACFGLGGLAYALAVRLLVRKLGERGLVLAGGTALGLAFVLAAAALPELAFPPLIATIGAGFYMLHNTLQTNATQMAPQARGTAIATFAFFYFLGQAAGVAALGWGVDNLGYAPIFAAAGLGLFVVALTFRRTLTPQRVPALPEARDPKPSRRS
jgi:predicted MFS family arabinose efflux permease